MFEAGRARSSVGMKGRKGPEERYKFVQGFHFNSTCYTEYRRISGDEHVQVLVNDGRYPDIRVFGKGEWGNGAVFTSTPLLI